MRAIDLTGQRFNKLVALRRGNKQGKWIFGCDCGNKVERYPQDVKNGVSWHCGCATEQRGKDVHLHPLYQTWKNMCARCSDENNASYDYYGERGIKVYFRWVHTGFEIFVQDIVKEIGLKPTPEHTLDRINNDGDYEPGNVRWATPKEQANNRRRK